MSPSPSTPNEQERVERYTCIGQRTGKGDKPCQVWLKPDGEEAWYLASKPLYRQAVLGGIYEVTATDTSVYIGGEKGPRYVGRVADEERLLEWSARDRIARQREAVRKQEAKDRDGDAIREALLPLRRLMAKRMVHNDKSALVSAVQVELWRPLTKQEQA